MLCERLLAWALFRLGLARLRCMLTVLLGGLSTLGA